MTEALDNPMHSEVPPADGIPVLTDVTAFLPPGHPYANPMPPADPAVAADPVPVAAADPAVVAPPEVETKTYIDGTVATGVAPLPKQSPAEQAEDETKALWRELRNYLNRLPDELQGKAHAAVSKLQKLL